jgi:hypothetical protein
LKSALRRFDWLAGIVSKMRVFETAQILNSRGNPNTSAFKMAPGRYDPVYEEGGQDYPLPHFSWTENQNMGHTSSCWQIGESC